MAEPDAAGDAPPAVPGDARPRTASPQRRRYLILASSVVLGAGAAAVAAGQTWWTQAHSDSLAGDVTTRATGSQVDSLLIPIALVALAGFGAALATTGVLRRAVGLVLVLGGGWAAALALIGTASAPASLQTDLTRPAESSDPARLHIVGPLSGTTAGLLVAVAGVLLISGFGAKRGLGTRYDAPRARRTAAPTRSVPDQAAEVRDDPDAAASWWKALDAGRDPTEPGGVR